MGEIFFLRNDSWAPGCATHESTMYCGCLWGCAQGGCVSIGNKSPSIPRMRTASQVSHSEPSSFSNTHRSWYAVTMKTIGHYACVVYVVTIIKTYGN